MTGTSGDADGAGHPGGTTPAEAFGTVANETRVAILRALWAAEEPQTFSQVRDAVGTSDSGQFNYHLGKLVGRFVRKREDRYELAYAGREVVGSIRSGVYTDDAAIEPLDVGACHDCGGRLRATYEDESVDVRCGDCGARVTQFGAPPTLLSSFDREALPGAFSGWVLSVFRRTQQGFCPQCSGRVDPSLCRELCEETGVIGAEYTCEVCGLTIGGTVGAVVLDHPAVVALHDDHGIDLRTDHVWSLPWLFEDHATVESEDPVRIRVVPEVDGDRVELVLDGELSVVAVDRDP